MNTQLSSTNVDTVLGRTIVEMGLATSQEVNDCVQLQSQLAQENNQRSLADLMISSGIVTERQMKRVRREVEESRSEQQIPGYQMLAKLGAGAMATVLLAREALDRDGAGGGAGREAGAAAAVKLPPPVVFLSSFSNRFSTSW